MGQRESGTGRDREMSSEKGEKRESFMLLSVNELPKQPNLAK